MIGFWKWGRLLARLEERVAAGAAEQAGLHARLDALSAEVGALAARAEADASERAGLEHRLTELATAQAEAVARIERAEERGGAQVGQAEELRSHVSDELGRLRDELGRLRDDIARDGEAGARREARVNQLAADLARVERQGAIDLAQLRRTGSALAEALLLRRDKPATPEAGEA